MKTYDISGITPEMVRAQFARNAKGLLECADRAKKKGGNYNGASEQQWREKAAIYEGKGNA